MRQLIVYYSNSSANDIDYYRIAKTKRGYGFTHLYNWGDGVYYDEVKSLVTKGISDNGLDYNQWKETYGTPIAYYDVVKRLSES